MKIKMNDIPALDDEWTLSTDAAELFGVSRQMLNRRIADGHFETVRTLGGKIYVISTAEVNKMLAVKKQDNGN